MVFGEKVPSIPEAFSNFSCVNINCDSIRRLGVAKSVKVRVSFVQESYRLFHYLSLRLYIYHLYNLVYCNLYLTSSCNYELEEILTFLCSTWYRRCTTTRDIIRNLSTSTPWITPFFAIICLSLKENLKETLVLTVRKSLITLIRGEMSCGHEAVFNCQR